MTYLDKLLDIFATKIKSLEILMLQNELKDVVRHGYYDNELTKVAKYCKQNKLFLIKSPYKIIPVDTDKKFSNKGISVKVEDPREGFIFVYISKDELLANKASYFEITQDHFNLGLILGYPECCCVFFQKNFFIRSKLDNDYEIPVLENSKNNRYQFFTNIFVRQKDYCLISHFPCKLDCEKSVKIAKNGFKLLKKFDEKRACKFEHNLKINLNKYNRSIVFF
jgi:hypothetical protein